MSHQNEITAEEALARLKEGNAKFLQAQTSIGDVSPQIRERTAKEGQFPYALVLTCSDSRVIPESIFSTGIGELFVVRVAGYVADKTQLGSIVYAVEHLHTPLVLVLGHTNCGAVGTALYSHKVDGHLTTIINLIKKAIGDEKDYDKAVVLNVEFTCNAIKNGNIPAKVVGAVYHIDSGKVEFLEN
ncbi:MAG: hypothetical protein IJU91_00125 [Selenomonadaceae bacterium]|nr:hypothetical protein [Selenomonadaceae bacterium]